MNAEDVSNLNTLLRLFTTHNVRLRRKRKTEALTTWKPIVEFILHYVKEKKECFASVQIFNSGSYYERTKVGEPDEFDLMLIINKAEFFEVTKRFPGLSKPPTGFTRGLTVVTKDFYSPTEVKSLFASLVRKAVSRLGLESHVTVRCQGPAVTLTINNRNGREYSVDLTLAIKHESWPEDAEEWRTRRRKGWPNQQLVQDICQDGCHLVAKHPKGDEEEKIFVWRYSFSAAEKKLFLHGGFGEASSCQKQVLRIMKALREELNLEPLNSYHLKTVLFYECEANPLPSQWSSDYLGIRFLGLLFRLFSCLLNSNCPHYFIREFNLFEAFTHQTCMKLAWKVAEIILNLNKVLEKLIKTSLIKDFLRFQSLLRERQARREAKLQKRIDLLEYLFRLLSN